MQFSTISPVDRTLPGATTPGQSRPGSDGSKGVLRIPPNSIITDASLSDCLVSYLGHSLWEGLIFQQSVYSTAPTDWAKLVCSDIIYFKRYFNVNSCFSLLVFFFLFFFFAVFIFPVFSLLYQTTNGLSKDEMVSLR